MKKHFKFIGLWAFLVVSFSILASILILEVNGLYFNPKNWQIQSTGLIYLQGYPKDVALSLNGQVKNVVLPEKMEKLFPGTYEIKVEKENYVPWTKTVLLKGGEAFVNKKIWLFLAKIEPQEINNNRTTIDSLKKNFESRANDLLIKDNEIWFDDELVTRFSGKLEGAIFMSDAYHIIFQVDDEIRVMDIDGSNNIALIKLKKPEKSYFEVYSKKIIFTDDGKIYEAVIR